jgi:hypothetical protein
MGKSVPFDAGKRLWEYPDLRDILSLMPHWAEGMVAMHKLRREADHKNQRPSRLT